MKPHLVAFFLLIGTHFSSADMVALSPDEKLLRQRITESPTHEEVIEAFESTHHLLYQEAIRWLILNRDLKTWNDLAAKKSKLKGNSYYLYPILDFMAEHPPESDKPLMLALRPEHLQMLARKGEALPPRYEYSYIDPPVDEVLYELLAKDLDRVASSSEETIKAARLLLRYRAPSEKLERFVQGKALVNEAEYKDEKIHRPPTQESSLPIKSPENNKKTPINQPMPSAYSWGYGWMIPSVFLVLLVIFACWRQSRKAQ